LFFYSSIASQGKEIDSLKNELKKHGEDTSRVKLLYNIGGCFYYKNIDSSKAYISKGFILAKKLGSKKWIGAGHCANAGALFLNNEDSVAEIDYGKAIDLLKDLPPGEEIITAYGGLANIFSRRGDYEKSIKYRFKQIDLAEKIRRNDLLSTAYSLLAINYRNLQDHKKSLLYMEKAVTIKEHLNDKQSLCIGYINLGGSYHNNEQYQKAIIAYTKALEIQKLLNLESLLNVINQGLCNSYIELKEYDKAIVHLEKVHDVFKIKENERGLMDVYMSYATIYEQTKKPALAEDYFLKALKLAKKLKNPPYELFINESLYNHYSEAGNHKLALEYYKLFMNETMRQNDLKVKEQTEGLEIKYQSAKKEEANKLLTETAKNQENMIKMGRYVTMGIVAFFVLTVLILILIIRQRKLLEIQKTTQLEQKLLRSQMNPHFIFNSLQAIQNYILKHEKEEAVKYLSSFANITRSVLENSRMERIPLKKEITLLENYLHLQKLRFGKRFDYQIHIDQEIDVESTEIPPMLSQPFIENALEHGMQDIESGGKIDVYFTVKNNTLLFEVIDNGKGIQTNDNSLKQHQSLALAITKERVDLMNKKAAQKTIFSINDAFPGEERKGVKVHFSIPLLNA
jgi:tetratricopeptide (TPR) repeat protein